MNDARRLRLGILFALGTFALVGPAAAAAGCGSSGSVQSGSAQASSTGAGGAGGSTSSGGGSGGGIMCANGQSPMMECFTLDQLTMMLCSPPMGGDTSDAGICVDGGLDGGTVLTDCLPAPSVRNDCCNPAMGGPTKQGDKCCYTFCTGSCC